ncbi:MAG: NfeD family protein [Rikenellaceae bacterium]|jgi:membrane-bound ClpP family serine protease|nr:NfeD family protein [Rikenellaceae bacterium]
MWLIVALVVVAALLLVAELILIPGISVAGIGALLADGVAIWIAFARYGTQGGLIAIGVIVMLSAVAVAIALRSKTWDRLSLKNNIDSTSQVFPESENVKVGERGVTVTRLAPMGKVRIGNETYEAKSIDSYVDENSPIEVTGFENFNVIVKKLNSIN